jgi:hypothetical protein
VNELEKKHDQKSKEKDYLRKVNKAYESKLKEFKQSDQNTDAKNNRETLNEHSSKIEELKSKVKNTNIKVLDQDSKINLLKQEKENILHKLRTQKK